MEPLSIRNFAQVLFFITFLVGPISYSNAQVVVDGVDINQKEKVKYCEIVAMQKMMSTKVIVAIDYGQETKLLSGKQQTVQGKDGKNKIFFSVIDALNFMEDNGWEYVNNYAVSSGSAGSVYHFLLKRSE